MSWCPLGPLCLPGASNGVKLLKPDQHCSRKGGETGVLPHRIALCSQPAPRAVRVCLCCIASADTPACLHEDIRIVFPGAVCAMEADLVTSEPSLAIRCWVVWRTPRGPCILSIATLSSNACTSSNFLDCAGSGSSVSETVTVTSTGSLVYPSGSVLTSRLTFSHFVPCHGDINHIVRMGGGLVCLVDRSCASVEFVQVSALAAPTLVPCGGVWGPFSADETVTASAVVSVKGSATEVQKEGALLCDAREITASFGVDTAASTAPIILLGMSSGRLCWLQVGPPSAAGGATCLINTGCIKGLTDEPIQSFRFVCTEEGPGVGSLFACGKHGRLYRLSDGAMVSLPSSSPLWAALTEAPCALVTCDASGSLTIATLDMRTGLSLLPSSTFLTPVPDCVDGCVSIVPFSFPATYDVIACILSADGCGFIGCDSYPKEDTVSITTAAQPIEEVLLAGIASAHSRLDVAKGKRDGVEAAISAVNTFAFLAAALSDPSYRAAMPHHRHSRSLPPTGHPLHPIERYDAALGAGFAHTLCPIYCEAAAVVDTVAVSSAGSSLCVRVSLFGVPNIRLDSSTARWRLTVRFASIVDQSCSSASSFPLWSSSNKPVPPSPLLSLACRLDVPLPTFCCTPLDAYILPFRLLVSLSCDPVVDGGVKGSVGILGDGLTLLHTAFDCLDFVSLAPSPSPGVCVSVPVHPEAEEPLLPPPPPGVCEDVMFATVDVLSELKMADGWASKGTEAITTLMWPAVCSHPRPHPIATLTLKHVACEAGCFSLTVTASSTQCLRVVLPALRNRAQPQESIKAIVSLKAGHPLAEAASECQRIALDTVEQLRRISPDEIADVSEHVATISHLLSSLAYVIRAAPE